MIDAVSSTKDKAGFPVVSWIERRGFGREKIECRIMKSDAGELYFVARGHVRHGTFEDGRPWQMLQAFAIKGAEELYQTAVEQALRRQHGNKGAALSALMRDNGKVLVAGFRVGAPMHLNCADAPLAALEHLHGILSEAFLHGAQLGMAAGWRCAADDDRIETYDTSRSGWPGEKQRRMSRQTTDRLSTALAWAVVALLVGGALVLLGVVRF